MSGERVEHDATPLGRDIDGVEKALRRWLEAEGEASWDPYDGASAAFPWSLACRNLWPARVLTQIVKRSPLNLRPVLGIRKHVFAKSLADLASAALLRQRLGCDPRARDTARQLLDRLRATALPGYAGACWGMPIPYVSRFIDAREIAPNLFWSVAAATAFLEAYELEGQEADLQIARSVVDFIRTDLGVVDEGEAGVWLPYFAGHDAVVFNVGAQGGALLRRVAHHTGEADLGELGRRALQFVVRHQNPDGSWWYARSAQGRWVDGFHTCYVLESLLQSVLLDGDEAVRASLERGVEFYVGRMFTPEGVPRYSSTSTRPFEIQNCAQAIQTLAKLVWLDREHLNRAERSAAAVIAGLYRQTRGGSDPAGYFAMSRGRWFTNSLPAIRWGEAPMLLSLAYLLAARRGLEPSWDLVRATP